MFYVSQVSLGGESGLLYGHDLCGGSPATDLKLDVRQLREAYVNFSSHKTFVPFSDCNNEDQRSNKCLQLFRTRFLGLYMI